MTVTEEDINALINMRVQPPIRRAEVWIEPDGLWAQVDLSLRREHRLALQVRLSADDPTHIVDVGSLLLEDRPQSRFLTWTIEQAINDALADTVIPSYLQSITMGKGVITIKLRPSAPQTR